MTSARYTKDFNEVKAIGGAISSVRTSYQAQTAMFWQDDTPTAMWDRVADSLALEHHLNLLQTARLLALTDISIADATIAVWDAKNAFNSWRPVTAIVDAGLDGNPNTLPDSAWLPLMTTPYFQEYPSAHSGVSSAAATVLASRFGDDTSFTVTSAGLPGVTRTFTSFSQAVAQVADARVLAGFHFRFSCDDGITLGSRTATYVEGKMMLPAHD
jgi:PAP2 superfamily